MRIMLILLCFFSFPCFSGDKIKIVKTCQLKKNESVQLLSLRTIDGDTLYLKFRNVITGAFLDTPTKSYDFFGDVVLSQCAYFHERRSLNNFHRDRVITFEQIAE